MTNNKQFKRPPLRMRRRHMLRQLFASWPWLVWLGAAIAILLLLPGSLNRIRFYAKAEGDYQNIAANTDGRIVSLDVEMGDYVKAGQILGRISNPERQVELMMDQGKLDKDDVLKIREEISEVNQDQAKDISKLAALESQQKHNQKMLEQGLETEQDLGPDLQPQINAMKNQIALYQPRLAILNEELEEAKVRAERFAPEKRRELTEREHLLIAEKDGIVEEVTKQPGEFVEKGQTIVKIVDPSTRRVIAFMPEDQRMDLAKGEACRIITETNRDKYTGKVISVTAGIRKLPVNTGFSDQLRRGRRIVIELSKGELLPGEQVVVVPDISIMEQWFGRKK